MMLDIRQVIRAIYYVAVTGIHWSNLPGEFPNYKSVYYHYRKWCQDCTWRRINQRLVYLERLRVGRLPRPSAGILGNLLDVVVSAANLHDTKGAVLLLNKVEAMTTRRLLKIWADKRYRGDLIALIEQEWDIQLEIVQREAG